MTEQTDAAEVEALLRIVRDGYLYAIPTHSVTGVPEAILRSDWLAAREAAAEVRGAQAVLAAVEGAVDLGRPPTGVLLDAKNALWLIEARARAAAAGGGGEG